jgi:mitochondrial fission protein ELM1
LDGIHEAKKEGWRIFNNPFVPVREKLLALKIIMQADDVKLLSEAVSTGNERFARRVSQIENR